jgi:plasmid stabilization system protein ParE
MLELYIQDPNDSFQTMSSYLWSNGYDLSESDIEDIVTDIKDKFDEAAAILDLRMDWRDWS